MDSRALPGSGGARGVKCAAGHRRRAAAGLRAPDAPSPLPAFAWDSFTDHRGDDQDRRRACDVRMPNAHA